MVLHTCRGLLLRSTTKVPQPGTVTHTAFSAGLLLIIMAKDWAFKFYHTRPWHNVRGYVLYRDQMLCQDCLKKGIYKPAEAVHHIVELTPENINDPNIALNPDNLISLCRDCHAARHSKSKKRYRINEDGEVKIK